MSNSDLRQRAAFISALMDQRDDIDVEIKAAFEIAKSQGYSPASLRKAIKVNRMDGKQREKFDDGQMHFNLYLEEIEGTAMRSAAE